jgi:Ni,Fe-hydrogenase III large subunit/Ni,Fe-hydrogenase III component G
MLPVWESLREKFGGSMRARSEHQFMATLDRADLGSATAILLTEHHARLVSVFAEDCVATEGVYYNYYVFERRGDPCYLVLQTPIPWGEPSFPSLAAELPSVNWQEREIQDWFGLEADGHPNPRRVALHDNWPDVHPLRKDFPLDAVLPAFEGPQHEYRPTLGEGVFQVPVGPVHAGIIEPGHFNFAVAGEPILYLQLRMFYTHKGTEKLFEHLPIHRAVYLAESISGDSSFSHGVAFCQAIERAGEIEAPSRARFMRTILLELERVYNHIADIGAIATDVGFVVANAHAGRIREIVVGVGGRASGVDLDVRRDHPYAAYGAMDFRVPVYEDGDVLHRMEVRIDEVRESIAIIRSAMAQLPEGAYRAPVHEVPAGRCALSAVEGWRGEILHWVRTAGGNRLERCKIKDPSINNWPAVVEAVQGNIIADFPVINKSFNLSYSGTDR